MERFFVPECGFYGMLHLPQSPIDPRIAVMVLGGSEGNENIPLNVGKKFAERGIAALGLCYWNVEGLPSVLDLVPLEQFERAIAFLLGRGFTRLYVYGISEGAKLALLIASLMPQIAGVIPLSPMHCLWNGMSGNKSMFSKKFTDHCEVTYRGREFPHMTADRKVTRGLKHLLLRREVDFAYLYSEPLKSFDEKTAIPVERIQGDILFIYASRDNMWPSKESVEYMTARLRRHGFPHRVRSLEYEKASHILVPLNPKQLRFFKIEREHPEECARNRQDAFDRTIQWILTPSERRPEGLLRQ